MYAYIWACMNSFDPVKIGENPKLFQNWLIGKHQTPNFKDLNK